MGSKRYEATQERCDMVRAMYGIGGLTVQHIADIIGVSKDTIERHHKHDLAVSFPQAIARVATSLYQTATDRKHKDHVNAARFWLKTRARWSETNVLEIRANVSDARAPVVANLSCLSIDQLRELETITELLVADLPDRAEPVDVEHEEPDSLDADEEADEDEQEEAI